MTDKHDIVRDVASQALKSAPPITVSVMATIGGFKVNGTTGAATLLKGQVVAVRVITAAGAVTVAATDYVVVNKTSGAATAVNLPAGVAGQVFKIKDGKGDAATNNITITPAAGTIDGAATKVISANYGVAEIIYNGTEWNSF